MFAAEARVLLAAHANDDALGGLLAEAFYGGRREQLLQREMEWEAELEPRATGQLMSELAHDTQALPRSLPRAPVPSTTAGHGPRALSVPEAKDEFARLNVELSALGSFGTHLAASAATAAQTQTARPTSLGERLGTDLPVWPLQEWRDGPSPLVRGQKHWPDELFFDVIEALDGVVARPRQRHWHDFHEGWDDDDYFRSAGQAVCRWRVTELLGRSEVPLRLAETGSDAGLLVNSAGDLRDELIEQVLDAPPGRPQRRRARCGTVPRPSRDARG